jgi:two-component system cell cycle response regulator
MNPPVRRLLVIDDDADLRKLVIKRFQRTDLEIDEAWDITEAKRKMYQNAYDIIILDLVMYPESGYILLQLLKDDPKLKWIPLIVLSGSNDVEDKVKCLELGADDYVTKPFHFKELNARVARLLARSHQFEQLSFRDGLTGAYNRRYFDNQITVELQRAKRNPVAMSLAILDIDRFKSINDTYGHQVGDQVLQGLSQVLRNNLRQTDLLCRYGGEEFVVLLLDTGEKEARDLMCGILEIVRTQTLAFFGEQPINITFSAGIGQWETQFTEADWIAIADQRLYQAKEQGRDRVVI